MTERANGIGLGFRMGIAEAMLEQRPEQVRWVEIHPENYMLRGGRFGVLLEQARETWPVVTHGLTMSFGCAEPFSDEYLKPLKTFLKDIEAPWHSDHACFGGAHGRFVHDLLPVPFTEEAVATMAARLIQAQDALDLPIAIENVSYYAAQSENPLDEVDFMVEVLERSGALLMLDVNNVYVNSKNFGFDPRRWIDKVPVDRVVQMHVAGHMIRPDGLRIDTHGESIEDGCFELLDYTLRRTGEKPVLLERDNNIPTLEELLPELTRLTEVYDAATSEAP